MWLRNPRETNGDNRQIQTMGGCRNICQEGNHNSTPVKTNLGQVLLGAFIYILAGFPPNETDSHS